MENLHATFPFKFPSFINKFGSGLVDLVLASFENDLRSLGIRFTIVPVRMRP